MDLARSDLVKLIALWTDENLALTRGMGQRTGDLICLSRSFAGVGIPKEWRPHGAVRLAWIPTDRAQ